MASCKSAVLKARVGAELAIHLSTLAHKPEQLDEQPLEITSVGKARALSHLSVRGFCDDFLGRYRCLKIKPCRLG